MLERSLLGRGKRLVVVFHKIFSKASTVNSRFLDERISVLKEDVVVDLFLSEELFSETRRPYTKMLLEASIPTHLFLFNKINPERKQFLSGFFYLPFE